MTKRTSIRRFAGTSALRMFCGGAPLANAATTNDDATYDALGVKESFRSNAGSE